MEAKIEIQYGELPYSCSLCNAFGHSLSRCINNPERVAKKQRTIQETKKPSHETTQTESHMENTENALVPYSTETLFECPVAQVKDEILLLKQTCHNDKPDENMESDFDIAGEVGKMTHANAGENDLETGEYVAPLSLVNTFQSLAKLEDETEQSASAANEEEILTSIAIIKRKRNANQRPERGMVDHKTIVTKVNVPGKNGFTPVINKKSLRQASKSAKSLY